MPENEKWEIKIASILHDPMDKALNYGLHVDRAKSVSESITLNDRIRGGIANHHSPKTTFDRIISIADINASASNRMLIIKGSAPYLQVIHPLSGVGLFDKNIEKFKDLASFPPVKLEEKRSLKELFYDLYSNLYKYYYRAYAGEDIARWILYLPEDTRIPASPIWSHLQMTSVFSKIIEMGGEFWIGIVDIGGVQDFIKNAKKTVDLWASSYIMSLISFSGMKYIVDEFGPDHIILPWLPAIPLAARTIFGNKEVEDKYLLLPVIPNSFTFIIPANDMNSPKDIMDKILGYMRKCWEQIRESVIEVLERRLKGYGFDDVFVKIRSYLENLEFDSVFQSIRLVGVKAKISEGEELEILDDEVKLVYDEIVEGIGLKEIDSFIDNCRGIIQYPDKKPMRNLSALIQMLQYALMISKFRRLKKEYVLTEEGNTDLCSVCGTRSVIDIEWEDLWMMPDPFVDYLEKLCPIDLVKRLFKSCVDIFFRKYFNIQDLTKFNVPSTSDISITWFKVTVYAALKTNRDKISSSIKKFTDLADKIGDIASKIPMREISKLVRSEDRLGRYKYQKIISTLALFKTYEASECSIWRDLRIEEEQINKFFRLPGEAINEAFLKRAVEEINRLCEKSHERYKLEDRATVNNLINKLKDLKEQIMHLLECYNELEKALQSIEKDKLAKAIYERIEELLGPSKKFSQIVKELGIPLSYNPVDYFSILMTDGDSIGKWISGAYFPPLILAYARGDYLSNILAKKEVMQNKQIFGRAVPLSPAVLSNISAIISMNSVLISKIVDTFGGFLIYSGGDDALALLPPEITHIVYILLRLAFSREYVLMDYHGDYINTIGMGWRATNSFGIFIADPKFNFRHAIEIARDLLEEYAKHLKTEHNREKHTVKDGLAIALASRSGILYRVALPNLLIGSKNIGQLGGGFKYIRTFSNYLTEEIKSRLDVDKYERTVESFLTNEEEFKGLCPDIHTNFFAINSDDTNSKDSIDSKYNVFMPMEFCLRVIYNILSNRLSRRTVYDLLDFERWISENKIIISEEGIHRIIDMSGLNVIERILIREIIRRAVDGQRKKENEKLARDLALELVSLVRSEPILKGLSVLCNIIFKVLSKSVIWRWDQ